MNEWSNIVSVKRGKHQQQRFLCIFRRFLLKTLIKCLMRLSKKGGGKLFPFILVRLAFVIMIVIVSHM